MSVLIHKNKNQYRIDIGYGIKNFEIINQILSELKITDISVFFDDNDYFGFVKNQKYSLLKIKFFEELIKDFNSIKSPLLIFDGEKSKCLINKELELFSTSKIMIFIDPEENGICLNINRLNVDITLERLKEILKND